jgi:hypothetical protein
MNVSSAKAQAVEYLVATINALVFERQELRACSAESATLEQNRLEIVRRQRELSEVLVQRYLASPEPVSPAR